MWNLVDLFSGRSSSRPAVPPKAAAKGKHDGNDKSSSSYFSSGSSSISSGSAPSRGKSGKSLISSALWAIARTPALVQAVERVEADYGDDSFLSATLRALRPADLRDPTTLKQVAESADAFLQANYSRLSVYDEIQPMEAIRAVLGLCGDSSRIFEESVETTYRSYVECLDGECRFRAADVEAREENLRCTNPKAQLAIELRTTSISKTDVCGKCKSKKAAKRYAVMRAAPCFVATWTALSRGDRGQDALALTTTEGESLRFTLAVVIATHKSKFVCMFSEGHNYYRVEGNSVKLVTIHEWQNVQPCLALFTRQPSTFGRASARGTGPASFTAGGGGKTGRKRGREENGSGQFRGGVGIGIGSGSGRPQGPAAAEVISIDDDDSDAGDFKVTTGGQGGGGYDPGDSTEATAGGDRASDSGHENGARTGRSGGREGNGQRATNRDGAGGARETRGVDDGGGGVDGMDVESEESRDAADVATAGISENGARRTGASGSAPSSGASTTTGRTALARPAAAAATAAAASRDRSVARDNGREGWSPAAVSKKRETSAEGDRRIEPNELRRATSPVNGSAPDHWMRQGEGSSGESSSGRDGGGGRGSSGGAPPGKESLPLGKRSRVGGVLNGESRGTREGLAAVEVNGSSMGADGDADNDEVELLTKSQGRIRVRDERAGSSVGAASSSAAAAPPARLSGSKTDQGHSSGWIPRKRPSDSRPPPPRAGKGNDGSCVAVVSGTSSGDSPDSPSSRRQQQHHHHHHQQQVRGSSPPPADARELQIHDLVDDDDSLATTLLPPTPPPREGTRHPSGVPMPFIGPARSPSLEAIGRAAAPFIGPARPPSHSPRRPSPPRPQSHATSSRWFTRNTKTPSESSRTQIRRKFPPASTAAKAGSRRAGGGAAKGAEGQKTMTSAWGGMNGALSSGGPARSGAGGRRCRGSGSLDDDEEWTPTGKGATAEGVGETSNGGGVTDGSNPRRGLRSGRSEKMTEDLTGADDSWQETGGGKSTSFGGGWESRLAGGSMPDEATLTTIRGINLQQDHFERIVDSDGWLTSQIIDIRVKQLQELYPQHLYFDSSFFGFLCPKIEKGGAFVVDYERVAGWTKRSRLPGGKSSLFDMRKLFIPINQGNIHWVLVVVDMDGGSGNGSGSYGGIGGKMVVSFFDSYGRDGTPYVEAVQQYLVSELSSRDKTRQGLFAPRPRPPANAPRQHNSSDCGVLMLHVMEELSCGPVDVLERLTQEEIMSLRLRLVTKIRE